MCPSVVKPVMTAAVNNDGCEQFLCFNSSKCIDFNLIDDLVPDCDPPDDEPLMLSFSTSSFHQAASICIANKSLPCIPGHPRCYPLYGLCVYDLDSRGNMRYCRNGAHLSGCEAVGCPDRYKCPGTFCIPVRRVCDGLRDCPGGEEEEGCHDTPLLCPGFFRCKGGACVGLSQVCDGDVDCLMHHDDELYCIRDKCPLNCICEGLYINCFLSITQSMVQMELKDFKSVSIYSTIKSFPKFEACFRCLILIVFGGETQSLKHGDLTELYNLAVLNLTANSISIIEARVFQNMSNLRILDLSRNPLLVIDAESFQGLSSLTHMQMSYSSIRDIPLFPQSILLKLFNISNSRLRRLNLSCLVSDIITIDIKDTGKLISLIPTLKQARDVTILTDLPIVCCMLNESVACKAPGTPENWCGRPFTLSETTVSVCKFIHGILISVVTIVVRMKTTNKNKLMKVVQNGFSITDSMLIVHAGMITCNAYFFDEHTIPKYWKGKYNWCNAAATIQMLGLNGYMFLIPCAGLAFIKGMQFGHHWSTRTVLHLLITIIALTLTYTLTMNLTLTFLGPLAGSLTDACSYILIGPNTKSVVWALSAIAFAVSSAWSICLVIGFYGMVLKGVIVINKEMTQIQAVSTGKRRGPMVVIKHFLFTLLFPCLTLLLPSIVAACLVFGIEISSRIQLQLSVHWLSIIQSGNSYIFLLRRLHSIVKQKMKVNAKKE